MSFRRLCTHLLLCRGWLRHRVVVCEHSNGRCTAVTSEEQAGNWHAAERQNTGCV